jgi:predicted ATPase
MGGLPKTGLVGREPDLEALSTALEDPGTRLVTLVGPGGIGKSALAAELAARVATQLASRVLTVDLAAATTSAELSDRVVAACGASAGDPLAALAALGQAVVVLDGFDALVATEAATVAGWLDRCFELAVIVTSHERLGIRDERVYPVGPLDPRGAGIELLVATARRAVIGFTPRPEDMTGLAELAALLEGIPLALELAGAWLPTVGVEGVLRQVRSGLVLNRRESGAPERHASIASAVRGAWERLGSTERDFLAQLTVFRGGFTVESVRGVIDPDGDPRHVVVLFDRLQACSLVRSRDAAGARFDLYGPIRELVVAEHSAPIAAAMDRHAHWFVDTAERLVIAARPAPHAREWLIAERDNLLEIARRVIGSAQAPIAARAEIALRAIVAAREVLFARGPSAELAQLVSPLVDRTRDSGADPKLSARALLLRGALRRDRGDARAALKDLLGAESVARALNDPLLMGEAQVELGKTLRSAGEGEAARETLEKAARSFFDVGARLREAEVNGLLAAVAGEGGDLVTARALAERGVGGGGDDYILGAPLHLVSARASAEAGDQERARRSAEAAEERATRNGDPRTAGRARLLRGLVLHAAGDLDGAALDLERARDAFAMLGSEDWCAIASGHLGVVARERGHGATAYATLADARDVTLRTRHPAHAAYFAAHLAALEVSLGRPAAANHILGAIVFARENDDPWWPYACEEAVVGPAPGTGLLARIFARGLGASSPTAPPPGDDALVIGASGTWFRPPRSPRVGLERRPTLALLLDRLATARVERPGAPLKASVLFGVAWPGEKALASAAAHRVRVAVATLRKMGLRDALTTTPDGYCLSPEIELIRTS